MSQRPPVRLGVRKPGLTAREAGKKVGRSTRTIQRWTSEPREVYLARADEKRVKVAKLRAKGMTMRAIAAEIGCSVGTVHRYAKQMKKAA